MKNTLPKKYRNKHISNLAKADQEILLVYDKIKMKGKFPSAELLDKQIHLLQKRVKSGSDIKYLFTCC